MADEEKIRQELASKRFTFSVMRDKDEQSVKTCGLNGSYGTPMTLVLDADGIVRWHGFNASAETAAAVEKQIDLLLQSFWVALVPDLPKELEAYAKGDYAKAHSAAKKILSDSKSAEVLRTAAETVEKNLEAGVKRLVDDGARSREQGYPARARTRLETVGKLFAGVPAGDEASAKLAALRADAAFARELNAEKTLENALEGLRRPKANRDAIRRNLENLAKANAESPVLPRIDQALATLK